MTGVLFETRNVLDLLGGRNRNQNRLLYVMTNETTADVYCRYYVVEEDGFLLRTRHRIRHTRQLHHLGGRQTRRRPGEGAAVIREVAVGIYCCCY